MFRRLFWMSVGAGVGLWGRRRAIDTTERYVPAPARRFISRTVRNFAEDVAEARRVARQAERETREARNNANAS